MLLLYLSDLGYLTHWFTLPIDHVITWFFKKALSLPSLGQWPPILASCDLSWVDHNLRVTWLEHYHVIMLYSQKCASPVSQQQWPSNLVGLWVRVKDSHLLFQVNCWSSDRVLFEKRHVSTNARTQNSVGDIKNRKTHKFKAFFVLQKILTFDSYRYTPL